MREFDGNVTHCQAMAHVRPGMLAVGCREGDQSGVSVYDSTTGKLLKRLSGPSSLINSIAFTSDALLAVCWDKEFFVWTRDASMQVCSPHCLLQFVPSKVLKAITTAINPLFAPLSPQFSEHAKHASSFTPLSLTPLTSSTVAIGGFGPHQVQIWDWKQGRLLQTLTGFAGGISCSALLPDTRLVAADWDGKISTGSINDWKASVVVISAGVSRLAGLVAARDGSFVTASQTDGGIKHWREGKCAVSLQGGLADDNDFLGNSLAVVGGRLLAVGKGNTVLMFE